jgi:hypothetical protein
MPKPTKLPEWASDVSAAIVEPAELKKDLGWVVEKPPHQFFNWWMNLVFLWTSYFDTTVDSILSAATALAGTVTTHIGATTAHGATGAVVGTTNNQTFTGLNKFDKEINYKAILASGVATPSAGYVGLFFDTTDLVFKYKNSAGAVNTVGGGAGGGIAGTAPVAKTANYTLIDPADDGRVILCDSSAGAFYVQFPAPRNGFKVTMKDVGGAFSTNAVTAKRNTGELIEGQGDYLMEADYGSWSWVSNGTDWFLVA